MSRFDAAPGTGSRDHVHRFAARHISRVDSSTDRTNRTPRILTIIGTRPEAVKMAPVVREITARGDRFEHVLATSGQHRELIEQMLAPLGLEAEANLALMEPGQTLAALTARALTAVADLLERVRPDALLVQGDTTTVMTASLAAFYAGVRVGHVEAGLRTADRRNPFPEEINRRLTGVLADWHFAPTERARRNLLAEGIADAAIHVTGNTIVDALALFDPGAIRVAALESIDDAARLVLVTAHRRESIGEPLRSICRALRRIAAEREDVAIVYPVHPNPGVAAIVREELTGARRVHLIEPLGYREMLAAMKRSTLVLTDSGGIQEEAPTLGVPVLVLRETTERPELIDSGAGLLVGTEEESIVNAALQLLDDDVARDAMRGIANPFGDGRAALRIVDALETALVGRR